VAEYLPYVTPANAQDRKFHPYGFSAKERDASELMYFEARYYDPLSTRFISPDPLFAAEMEKCIESIVECNLYQYTGNNPVNFVDPDGTEIAGVNNGGSMTLFGFLSIGISITQAVDHNGDSANVITPEIGFGTPGASAFSRVVISEDATSTVSDLYGAGTSLSLSLPKTSFSGTLPGTLQQAGNSAPIYEAGKAYGGKAGASLTIGYGMSAQEFVDKSLTLVNAVSESIGYLVDSITSKAPIDANNYPTLMSMTDSQRPPSESKGD
jgi:RHS repeat-associated protein